MIEDYGKTSEKTEKKLQEEKEIDASGEMSLCPPKPTEEQGQSSTEPAPAISKRLRKKLDRKARHAEQKKDRRRAEKERRRERRRAAGVPLNARTIGRHQITPLAQSRCTLRVAIDLAYEHLMDEWTLRKTITQLVLSYAVNRRTPEPVQFHLVGLQGRTRELFEQRGHLAWDAHLHGVSLDQCFPESAQKIVYLSADSPNVLGAQLDPEKVYVIGGLLDHNRHKGLCHSIAVQRGYEHARLPIDEHMVLRSRKVLTINQVFELLVRVGSRGESWAEALWAVIPPRKGPVERSSANGEDEKEGEEEVGEKESSKEEEEQILSNDDGK